MDDGSAVGHRHTVEHTPPDEVFKTLASEKRLEILRAMMDAPDRTYAFSELFDVVDIDDSGQMYYHLSELLDIFVRKVPHGYRLNFAGRMILGTVYAGTYTASGTVDPLRVDGSCWDCGGDMTIEFAGELARMRCTSCDREFKWFFPPGSIEQFEESIPEIFDRWYNHLLRGIIDGFCPICHGRMDGQLLLEEGVGGFPAHAEFQCRRCGFVEQFVGITPAMLHPIVEGFLIERLFGLEDDPVWWIDELLEIATVEILSSDPPRIEVRFVVDGEEVAVEVDEHATVAAIER